MLERTEGRGPRIIAVTNQKGGVAKTTTTINLAAGLAELGARVLVIDLDPQGNASTGFGIVQEDRVLTTYDLMIDEESLDSVIQSTKFERISICPANSDLSAADVELVANEKRSYLLHDSLRQNRMAELGFDFVLIDCPPSLSLLTVNALVASDSVLIPLQSEFFALEGLSQLMLTIREIRQTANRGLRIEGVLLTMFDRRNNLSQMVETDARENLGDLVFKTVIPRNVRVSEAPSFAMPVLSYDSTSKGSAAYRALSQEIATRYGVQETLKGNSE